MAVTTAKLPDVPVKKSWEITGVEASVVDELGRGIEAARMELLRRNAIMVQFVMKHCNITDVPANMLTVEKQPDGTVIVRDTREPQGKEA